MSLSVDKFTTTRKASLLEQAKDAISAIKKKQTLISPQESKATNNYYRTNKYDKKRTLAFKKIKLHRTSRR